MNLEPERFSLGTEEVVELGVRREKRRVPAATGWRVARKVERALEPYLEWQMVAGSLRRGSRAVGDVEFVALPVDLEALIEFLDQCGFTGRERKRVGTVDGVKVEIYIAHGPEELGAMLLWFTGDWQFNIAMNAMAKRKGYARNQYGIWNPDGTPALQSDDERDFFDFLGMEYHAPADRSFAERGSEERKRRASVKSGRGGAHRRMGAIDDGLFGRIGEALDFENAQIEGDAR